jgi:hypothetical protein
MNSNKSLKRKLRNEKRRKERFEGNNKKIYKKIKIKKRLKGEKVSCKDCHWISNNYSYIKGKCECFNKLYRERYKTSELPKEEICKWWEEPFEMIDQKSSWWIRHI